MKNTFIFIVTLTILGGSLYLRQDPFSDNKYRIYDGHWNRKGYVIQDRFNSDRLNIYDERWERQGYIEPSWDKWDLEKIETEKN